jgi:hypothetical protein
VKRRYTQPLELSPREILRLDMPLRLLSLSHERQMTHGGGEFLTNLIRHMMP